MSTIFYSWQADTPRKTGKDLVHSALEEAVKMLNAEAEVEDAARDELEVDSDTKGVPGSPEIVRTIFSKIDDAQAFVADMTFVGVRRDGRPMPNPNVAIEYGWALKSRTHDCVVAVMNIAHGKPTTDNVPFDIRHIRWPITFNCPDDADAAVRKAQVARLATELKGAIGAILGASSKREGERLAYVPIEPACGRSRFRSPSAALGIRDPAMIYRDGVSPQSFYLAEGPTMWLRLLPSKTLREPIRNVSIRDVMRPAGHFYATSLNLSNAGSIVAVKGADGFGYATGPDESGVVGGVFFCFESGEIWTIDALTIQNNMVTIQEDEWIRAIKNAAKVLRLLGVSGPFHWSAGLEGVANSKFFRGDDSRFAFPVLLKDVVERSGQFSGDEADAGSALEPFFVAVYDAASIHR